MASVAALAIVLGMNVTSGCSGSADSAATPADLAMASMVDMPKEVQTAPGVVQQAYQFSAANPELMKHIPCYCGCGAMGHTSNYACYVSEVDAAGKRTYDSHALGCSICVDITQGAMRLTKEGKTAPEIKAYVDANYAKYGPSNMP